MLEFLLPKVGLLNKRHRQKPNCITMLLFNLHFPRSASFFILFVVRNWSTMQWGYSRFHSNTPIPSLLFLFHLPLPSPSSLSYRWFYYPKPFVDNIRWRRNGNVLMMITSPGLGLAFCVVPFRVRRSVWWGYFCKRLSVHVVVELEFHRILYIMSRHIK